MMVEDNEKYGKQIFHDIRQKWESENVLEESAKWLCKNSSKEFVLKAIKDFSESDQQKVKQALKLVQIAYTDDGQAVFIIMFKDACNNQYQQEYIF